MLHEFGWNYRYSIFRHYLQLLHRNEPKMLRVKCMRPY